MILQRRGQSRVLSPSSIAMENSTTSSSPGSSVSHHTDGQQEDTGLLCQILQEVQMLKEIIGTLIQRRSVCSRTTQTECHTAGQVSNNVVSPKPLNLSANKRSNRALSDSTPMRQAKLSRISNNSANAACTSSIEEAVAKIKAIRSEKFNSKKTGGPINNCASPRIKAEHSGSSNNGQVVFLPAQFRCSAQQQPVVDMLASASATAATATGCYTPVINADGTVVAAAAAAGGGGGGGMLPFSPLIDSLVLSPHCASYGEVGQNVMVDFVQQNSAHQYPSIFPDNYKACQKVELATLAMATKIGDSKSPATTAAMTAKGKHDSKSQKTFTSDYYKPYACQHMNCNKRFANKFLLKKHEFIHTGERPHQCPYCSKRFNRKDNLLRHKKTHEPNNVLVKRTVRPLGFCETNVKPRTGSVAKESVSQFKVESTTGTAEGSGGEQDAAAAAAAVEEEEENGSEKLAKLNQECSTSEGSEFAAGVAAQLTTPSDNLLLSAVSSKTTSTSQLPMTTSFRVTN